MKRLYNDDDLVSREKNNFNINVFFFFWGGFPKLASEFFSPKCGAEMQQAWPERGAGRGRKRERREKGDWKPGGVLDTVALLFSRSLDVTRPVIC